MKSRVKSGGKHTGMRSSMNGSTVTGRLRVIRRPLRKATPDELRNAREFLGYKVVIGGNCDTRGVRFDAVASVEMKFVVS